MSSFADTVGINSLRKYVEASQRQCDELASQFETAQTAEQRSEIAREHEKAMKRKHAMQFLLELQERREKETGVGGTRD